MSRTLTPRTFLLVFAVAFLSVPFLLSQQTSGTAVPPAPVPTQILTAKKVFISNPGGEEVDPRTFDFPSVDPNRPYNQLFSAIKSGGKYEPVLAPSDADLILEIHFAYQIMAREGRNEGDPRLKLVILDPKTHVLLWAFTQRVAASSGPHWKEKRENNFNQAMAALVSDLTKLAAEPTAPGTDFKK